MADYEATWNDPQNGKANKIQILHSAEGTPSTVVVDNIPMGQESAVIENAEPGVYAVRGVNTDTTPETVGPISNVVEIEESGGGAPIEGDITEIEGFKGVYWVEEGKVFADEEGTTPATVGGDVLALEGLDDEGVNLATRVEADNSLAKLIDDPIVGLAIGNSGSLEKGGLKGTWDSRYFKDAIWVSAVRFIGVNDHDAIAGRSANNGYIWMVSGGGTIKADARGSGGSSGSITVPNEFNSGDVGIISLRFSHDAGIYELRFNGEVVGTTEPLSAGRFYWALGNTVGRIVHKGQYFACIHHDASETHAYTVEEVQLVEQEFARRLGITL